MLCYAMLGAPIAFDGSAAAQSVEIEGVGNHRYCSAHAGSDRAHLHSVAWGGALSSGIGQQFGICGVRRWATRHSWRPSTPTATSYRGRAARRARSGPSIASHGVAWHRIASHRIAPLRYAQAQGPEARRSDLVVVRGDPARRPTRARALPLPALHLPALPLPALPSTGVLVGTSPRLQVHEGLLCCAMLRYAMPCYAVLGTWRTAPSCLTSSGTWATTTGGLFPAMLLCYAAMLCYGYAMLWLCYAVPPRRVDAHPPRTGVASS